MQASSPNSNAIKLTTTASTTKTKTTTATTNQHNLSTSNTSNIVTTTTGFGNKIQITKSNKLNQSTIFNSISNNNNKNNNNYDTNNHNNSSIASREIEEISKKISEHADAIYRTWKYRGLAPTELLDIYTNEVQHNVNITSVNNGEQVADIFSGSVEAAAAVAGNTEGLQKLVSQFVIKDKEQRGVKTTASSLSSLSSLSSVASTYGSGVNLNKSQRTEAVTIETTEIKIMPENIGSHKMTQKTGNSNSNLNIGVGVSSGGGGGTLKQATSKTPTNIKKPSTTPATSASSIFLKTGNSNENSSIKKLAKPTGVTTTTPTTTTSAKTASSTSPSSSSSSVSPLSPSAIATSTASLKTNACVKNVNSAQQQRNNNTKSTSVASSPTTATTTTITATTTTTTPTKRVLKKGNSAPTLDINLNLDLGFDDLQLDVNSLSQLQTQNLLKITELLQENTTQSNTTMPKTVTTKTTTTQEPKKATTTTKTKIKRPKSPAKLQDSTTTVTDSPIVTKTKSTKVVNENDQTNNNSNNNNSISVKKIAKNNNNISINDKSNCNNKINNSNDCTLDGGGIGIGEINDATINKLINTSGKTTTTKPKSNAITTKNIIARTKATTITNDAAAAAAATTSAATPTATAMATATMPIANVVSSVKTVDHQSIKSLDSNSGGSCTLKQPQAAALNDNVAQQLTSQKSLSSATPAAVAVTPKTTIKSTIKSNKIINESENKINSTNISNIKTAVTTGGSSKPQKSVKSANQSLKATTATGTATATVVASNTTANSVMEIAPQSNDQINNININGNEISNGNGNGNGNENSSSNMPAPTKLNSGRAALGASQDKLNRPFLTRGSVAERVLMFEKCPGVRNSFLNIKRPDLDVLPKSLRKVSVKLHSTPPGNQQTEQNSLQKEIRTTRSVYIPRFYFPHGKPQPQIAQERIIRGILSAFDSFPNNQVTKDELPQILKICGLPFYWRMPVVVFCQQNNSGLVERSRFLEFWKQMNIYCHDAASRFVYIHSRGQRFRSYIAPEDLVPLVQDVVDTHPGLAFLKEATEFHSRYVHTVIARIFYSVNRSWSGKITIAELKKSDLLDIIQLLEEEDDINQIMAFFSYEHFYVIYCKFWELDKDHDLLINQDDLARHSDHALSTRIVERIFSGCVTRNDNKKHPNDEPKMSYTDFVWFLLSEEDKRTPTAIEYWFRCMDLDGDGLLSMYELEYFYEEQQQRMESIGIETLPFEDCLCQMLDMIKPQQSDAISLGDLKRCRMTQVFFDTFFNLEKYLDHEQRDPFATQRDEYSSDWDRFAAHEYELLISEENG